MQTWSWIELVLGTNKEIVSNIQKSTIYHKFRCNGELQTDEDRAEV